MRGPAAFVLLPLCLMIASPAVAQAPEAIVPTIPESQIAPAPLSSPFEFLSVATSADAFIIQAAALADTNTENEVVRSIARNLAKRHASLSEQSQAVAMAGSVDIGKSGVDGEQSRLLGRLEALHGAEFDSLYLDSQIFVHQRTIAYYRGYADQNDALGRFATEALPMVIADYVVLVGAADGDGSERAPQKPKS